MKDVKIDEVKSGNKIMMTSRYFRYRVIFEVDHATSRHLYLRPYWTRDESVDEYFEGDGNIFVLEKEKWITQNPYESGTKGMPGIYLLSDADVLMTIMGGGKHPEDDDNFMETWEGQNDDA